MLPVSSYEYNTTIIEFSGSVPFSAIYLKASTAANVQTPSSYPGAPIIALSKPTNLGEIAGYN